MILLIIAALFLLLAATWLFCHRDPERTIQRFNGYLSPANGTIVDIYDVKSKKQFIKKHGAGITAFLNDFPQAKTIVVIMMHPWHVHTQRAPTDCTVKSFVHKPGTYLNAVNKNYRKATVENEHVAFTLTGKRPCKVYLIAGTVARRIKPIAIKRQALKQGDRLGKIAFGSQVAIVLPKVKLLIKVGDKVTDGITRIAQ